MFKRILAMMLTLSILLATTLVATPAAAGSIEMIEILEATQLRTTDSGSSDSLRGLSQGEYLTVHPFNSSKWYKAQDYTGLVGYVLKEKSQALTAETINQIQNYAITNPIATILSRAKLYITTKTGDGFFRYLEVNEQATIRRQVSSRYFEMIDQHGNLGYFNADPSFSATSSEEAPAEEAPAEEAPAQIEGIGMFEIISATQLRTTASGSSDSLKGVALGEYLTLLPFDSDSWYKAQDYTGLIGYVRKDKAQMLSGDELDQVLNYAATTPTATILNKARLYNTIKTDDGYIHYLEVYQQATILRKVSNKYFEMLDQQGNIGYFTAEPTFHTTQSVTIIPDDATASGRAIIEAAQFYLGTPYESGSLRNDTTTFDCSEFSERAYRDAHGTSFTTHSGNQGAYAKANGVVKNSLADLRPGDLVFFMANKGDTEADYANIDKEIEEIDHVAIYVGNGIVIHAHSASESFGGVKYDTLIGTRLGMRVLYGVDLLSAN